MTILGTRHTGPTGKTERIDYEWQGGPVVRISMCLLDELDINPEDGDFMIGPYRLHFLEMDWMRQTISAVRKDRPLWWVLPILYRSGRLLDIFYHRSIITLAVWNLAEIDRGTIPTWRDIRLVKWIIKK